MPRTPPPWELALRALSAPVAADLVRNYHHETIGSITALPDDPVKDYAIAAVIQPEHVARNKTGDEVSHTVTLDERVQRALGKSARGLQRSALPINAGRAAIEARYHLLIAPWHNGHKSLKQPCDNSKAEDEWLQDYVAACKKARVDAAGELESEAKRRGFGKAYGAESIAPSAQPVEPTPAPPWAQS